MGQLIVLEDITIEFITVVDKYLVDVLIVAILLISFLMGLRKGFWRSLYDLVRFVCVLAFAFWAHRAFAGFIGRLVYFNEAWLRVAGFGAAMAVAEIVSGMLGRVIASRTWVYWSRFKAGSIGGLISLVQGAMFLIIFIEFVFVLPLDPHIKQRVIDSKLGGWLANLSFGLDLRVASIFGEAFDEPVGYVAANLTSETMELDGVVLGLETERVSEQQMYGLVNVERGKVGVGALEWSEDLAEVAREHGTDMWERGYFSHYNIEREQVGDRLRRHGDGFFVAGENLAMAPSVELAHKGLMNSTGHRRNMLDGRYKKVGIGAVSNDFYGVMFVQVFTD